MQRVTSEMYKTYQKQYGNDLEELARLSSEAKEQPTYKRGTAIAIAGCLGTGISVFQTAKYGAEIIVN